MSILRGWIRKVSTRHELAVLFHVMCLRVCPDELQKPPTSRRCSSCICSVLIRMLRLRERTGIGGSRCGKGRDPTGSNRILGIALALCVYVVLSVTKVELTFIEVKALRTPLPSSAVIDDNLGFWLITLLGFGSLCDRLWVIRRCVCPARAQLGERNSSAAIILFRGRTEIIPPGIG